MAQIIADRYQVVSEIGHGGMGKVYKGTDTRTGLPVAIKQLKPEATQYDPTVIERFRREAEALARLNHPNIVKVLDTLEEGSAEAGYHHYIIMEYCGRGDLAEIIKNESPLPIDRVLTLAIELADALTRAHYLDIIHRDIKPANVLIADDGSPRLTDFGVAHFGAKDPMTGIGIAVGTLAYLPPEAIDGNVVDSRADIWSFGVMLFEMLTGQKPFDAEHAMGAAVAIIAQPTPDLEALRPDCPIALVDLVNRMLEKEPDARITSARLIGAELEMMIKGETDTTAPILPIPRLGDTRFATPLIETGTPKNNLPAQTTPFVGREQELDQLLKLLSEPDTRLLTILAPGGMGKTRLGLETASRVVKTTTRLTSTRRFLPTDGVYFVELAPLNDPEAIVSAVAEAIGYSFQQDERGSRRQLLDFLREKRMLLVLDNFEHLLDGALLVADILGAAEHVKIIATSRERLNLQEEILFRLSGLDLPDTDAPEDPLKFAAIRLFVQGARRALPGYELQQADIGEVTRICRLVEGMPLAILLASAWLDNLTLAEITGEIRQSLDFLATEARNVPERQRSMRAVFDYSWNLLPEDERTVLMTLAVFRAGMTRDAAQAVAGATLRQLTALVNKSLLRRDAETGRYGLHELLRQYLEARLDSDTDASGSAREHHAVYFTDLLHSHAAKLTSRQSKSTLELIAADLDNILQALRWAVETHSDALLAKLWMPLLTFYEASGRYSAGARTFQDASERCTGAEDDLWLWRLRLTYAAFANQAGDQVGEPGYPAQALKLFRQRGTPNDVALALNIIAFDAMRLGKFAEAKADADEAATLLSDDSDPLLHGFTLGNQSYIAFLSGDYVEAERLARLDMERADASGDSVQMARTRNALGEIYHALNREQEAKPLFEASYALFKQIGNRPYMAFTATNIGNVLHRLGRYEESLAPYQESLTLHRETGNRRGVAEASNMLAGAWLMLGDYERAIVNHRAALAVFRDLGDLRGIANSLAMLNSAEVFVGDYDNAIPHAQECLALRQQMGNPMEIADALGHLGRAYGFAGQYSEAQATNDQILDLARQYEALRFPLQGLFTGTQSQLLLLQERYDELLALVEPSLPALGASGQAFILMTAYLTVGTAYSRLGRRNDALPALRRALAVASESQARNWAAASLAELAHFKAEDGDAAGAVVWISLALEQGKMPLWLRARVQPQLDALRSQLPADVFQAAVERGRTLDFEAVVGEALAAQV